MEHINLIAKSFKVKSSKISPSGKVSEYEWDSLTKITLITEFNKKYKKNIDFRKFEKIKTFGELDKLIQTTVKS
jgi:acyl carrier protein